MDHNDAAFVAEICDYVVSALSERDRLHMRAAIAGTTPAELKLAIVDVLDAFSRSTR